MRKVAFHTLGCKLNFSETSTIARSLHKNGFKRVEFHEKPDLFVLNTCSVTDNADKKCHKIVQEAKKKAPQAKVVVVGCYAQLKPVSIVNIPGVDAVLGAAEKFRLADHLSDIMEAEEAQVYACEIDDVTSYESAYSYGDRTRTFLKVQDGCNYNCSFCTIPLARGKSRSDSIQNIVRQAQEIARTEVKEVVLTGVNIGDFGIQDGRRKEKFIDLIKELDLVEGIERFRISSIEPNLLNDDIIEFVAGSDKFVPHFHIPLQSGSDALLRAMLRRYDKALYENRVRKIKKLMPDCCIGVDVITGFPGETEELFLETYEFLNQLPISYLHVFTYSERDNTRALQIKEVVPVPERKRRSKMLRILSEKKRRQFYQMAIGQIRNILFESSEENGWMLGYTDNYVRVRAPFQTELANRTVSANLAELNADGTVDVELSSKLIER